MQEYIFSAAILVQIGLLFQGLGLLARDQLVLRILILIGTGFYVLYYYFVSDQPLWEAILSSAILGVINLGMIIQLLIERTTFAMGTEMTYAFKNFPNLTPGQFRKLMRIGEIVKPKPGDTLCTAHIPNERLYFLLEGRVAIHKGTVRNMVAAPMFLGEVSFLSGTGASATVITERDVVAVEWRAKDLRELMRKSTSMEHALMALLNADLASKVSQSAPILKLVS